MQSGLCVFASIALLACSSARADLASALRRSAPIRDAVASAIVPIRDPLVVHLEKVSARPAAHLDVSFYVGKLFVGRPQQVFEVIFDTASGNVVLPHRACKSPACLEHRRYSPGQSRTAMDVNVDDAYDVSFAQSDLGAGMAQAWGVRDLVCLDVERACTDITVLAFVKMEDTPFRAMPNDGIVGLGLPGLGAGSLASLFGRFVESSQDMLPQFGISLRADSGDIFFGSHDPARIASPIQWFPVDHPEDGFWQVSILSVRAGNVTVSECRQGCHGIVDTGVSRLGVQSTNVPKLKAALASARTAGGRCQGPDLLFDLGGFMLILDADDYADSSCVPQLSALDLEEPQFSGVYAFGETVLRRYYAAFDWETLSVGFAPAAGRAPSIATNPVQAPLMGQMLV